MACTAVILLLAPLPGWASNLYTWSGAASALWSNPSNWSPNGVPTDGDTLAFPSGAANLTNTNDLAAFTSFISLVFNGSGYTLNGNGIVLTSSLSTTVGGTTTVNLPINVGTNAVTFNANDLVLGGSLSGSGPITTSYTGGNGVRIAASGSYSGTITANGHLWFSAVSLPITAIASGAILHLDGASLPATAVTHTGGGYAFNGYGTIGALTASGPVFPGNSYSCGNATATQINTGNVSLNGQGCFALNGAAAGTSYSQLNVAGTVSLGAGSSLNVSLSPSYVPAQGQSFVLINNDGADPVSGTFNGLPEGSVITLNSVYQFTISYVGGSGNDVVLTCTVAPHAWTGATNALWSNPNNWNPATVPLAGDTLLFPSGAANTTNTNDLAAFTSFTSLVVSGGSYTLNGNAIVLTTAISATAGSTTINLPINVSNNAVTFDAYDLLLGGSLSGTGPITTSYTGGYGVHIAASGSYSGTITANGHLWFTAVSLPTTAINSSAILHLDGASLPVTTVNHSGSYAFNGYGTIGALTATGPVFPGNSYSCGNATATQINTGDLSLNGQGCFVLNGAAAGIGYSQLNTTGTVSLGAGSTLNVTLSPSYIPAQGQTFVVINNDGTDPVSGTFNGLPEGSVFTLNSVYQFTISYVGGSGNDVVLTCTVAPHAWTGATSALWSNPNNWNPATVPLPGDTLLFPSGAANLTNTNDLAAFTSFANLVFNGSAYTLNGNAIVLTNAISATTGSTTINLPINVSNNAVTFDASDLVLGGSLSGTGSITTSYTGGNGVRIAASGSYSGTITANGHLWFNAVSLPITAIASGAILHLDGASLPATAVTHTGGGYAFNGYGTIGALTASGPVFPGNSYSCGGATATQINTSNVSLNGYGCFALNGAAAGTGYSQLNTTGTVSLGAGSTLNVSLSPSFIPAQGQTFVLIKNDGTDPVSGTFNGKPEGSVITLNTVYQFVLSYIGGSGNNDVVLTSLNGLPLPTVTLVSSLNPSTPGQNVTFTATVSGSGPVPTGTVTFLDGFSTLASTALNGSGVATYSTTLLGVGTHTISAQYNSDANYGGAVSSTLAQVVGQASQFLTFDPAPTVTVGGTGTVLATSANPNSGNPIQYSTLSTDCSVNSSSGVVTGIQVGTNNCTITASQAGNANYLAGSASQILSVSQVTSSLVLGSTCMRTFVESQSFTFSAVVTGLSPTGTVTFDDGNFQTLCSSVPLSAGTATCTSTALTSPSATTTTYLLGAGYSGDGNNTASVASAPLVVVVLSAADVPFRDGFESATAQCPVE